MILANKNPFIKSLKYENNKLIVDVVPDLYKDYQENLFLHIIGHGPHTVSKSSSSTTNTVEISEIGELFSSKLTLACTIKSYVIRIGTSNFDFNKLIKIFDNEYFLNDKLPSALFQKDIFLHKSFLYKVKNLKEFFYGEKENDINKSFTLNFLGKNILVSINKLHGKHQVWKFFSSDKKLLTFIFNIHLKKLFNFY